MKVKVINSSSRKTREKIKKSFALLLKEKQSLNKITVTDLVREADITRSAFYTHYDNIYDIAKELQDETFDILINNIDKLKSPKSIDPYFDEIFLYLKRNEEIYSMILSSNDPLLFTETLSNIIFKSLCQVLNYKNKEYLEINITLFIDGCISLLVKYYRNEIHYSLDEINFHMKETFKKLFLDNEKKQY